MNRRSIPDKTAAKQSWHRPTLRVISASQSKLSSTPYADSVEQQS
jgi:hypothetical protein